MIIMQHLINPYSMSYAFQVNKITRERRCLDASFRIVRSSLSCRRQVTFGTIMLALNIALVLKCVDCCAPKGAHEPKKSKMQFHEFRLPKSFACI